MHADQTANNLTVPAHTSSMKPMKLHLHSPPFTLLHPHGLAVAKPCAYSLSIPPPVAIASGKSNGKSGMIE